MTIFMTLMRLWLFIFLSVVSVTLGGNMLSQVGFEMGAGANSARLIIDILSLSGKTWLSGQLGRGHYTRSELLVAMGQ